MTIAVRRPTIATRRPAVAVLALLLAACAKPDVLQVEDRPGPVRSPDQVQLLLEAPDRPYRTIGLIRSRKADLFNDVDDLKRQVREAAGRIGADAVILSMGSDPESTGTGTTVDGSTVVAVSGGGQLRLYGRAIVFEER